MQARFVFVDTVLFRQRTPVCVEIKDDYILTEANDQKRKQE